MAVISASKWPSTRVIKPENKYSLLQNLVMDELVTKRVQHLVAFSSGLEKYGIQTVCSQFLNQCKELFVYENSRLLSADKLLTMIRSSPSSLQERLTLDWFVEYLTLR